MSKKNVEEMLKNYLLVTFRNLKKYKTYSIVNISGLAIGMSAFILIALLLNNENNWDKFHADGERIYRVQTLVEYNNSTQEWKQSVYQMAEELRSNFPEFELTTVIREVWGELLSANNDKVLYEQQGFYIEPQFFEMFSVKFLQGNSVAALQNEKSIIITDEFAKKHFPNENPMGKSLVSSIHGHLIVSAVVERWSEQSHFRPSYFISFKELEKRLPDWKYSDSWDSFSFRNYVKLKPNIAITSINSKIRNILDDKIVENNKRIYLRPLNKLHLAATVEDENNTPLPYYEVVAWFVLLLACINYINLTTAKSAQREKEIGIRKVIGSNRFELFKQFIGESLIITLLALVLSFFIAELLLPTFNTFMQRNLVIEYFENYEFTLFLIGIMVLVGIVSGIYPALYLSSFDPINVIKGFTTFNKATGSKGKIRKLLVGFQFVISIVLILLTYFVFNQVQFMKTKDLGYEIDNLVRIYMPNNNSPKTFEDLRTRLRKNSNVVEVSIGETSPFFGNNGWEVNWEGGTPDEKISSGQNRVSHSFINTFNMKIIEGRDFSKEHATDDKSVIVNETFVKKVGWENPIGKTIQDGEYTVIGVVEDFHANSIHSLISPYMMLLHKGNLNRPNDFVIKVSEYNKSKTVDEVREILKEFFPNSIFQIQFYESQFEHGIFEVWEGVQATFGYFSFITIVIALIGVIGLLSFSVEKKTKEIGIRKVLGASLKGLYLLINKDFFIIFIVSLVIALPIAIMVIGNTPGAYKFEMGLIDYILPIFLIGFLSLTATCIISIKAAIANPVDSLRSE